MATNPSLQTRLKSAPTATAKFASGLFREMAPKVLFFFIALMLIFLLFKLFVAQYSIEFSAFTQAAVAALILGKLIPLLDWARFGSRFENHRRIVAIACKTFLYAVVVIVFGVGERILKAAHKEGSLSGGLDLFISNANMQRFLGLVLLISMIVGAYLTLQSIDDALGKGTLLRLLFERPGDKRA